jgi:DNA-binding IclR family transcriptional regulator
MSNTLQSVDRALRILLSFEEEGQETTLGDLAAMLGVHKSTASRLVATLRKHDLLERGDNERFRLGPEVARLGMLALGDRGLNEVAREPLTELAAATGETVTLGVLHAGELTTVIQFDSRYVVGPQNWVGRRTPVHATSDGKVWLAFGGAKLPRGRLVALTDNTHTRRDELERELEEVRRRGWAQAIGELEDGLHGAAAPVFDAFGRCRAAVSVSGPSYRVTPEELPRLGELCRRTAGAIGALLVGGGEPAGDERNGAAARRSRARGAGRATGGDRRARTAAPRH